MRITLLVIGKTQDGQLQSLIADYARRLNHYVSFDLLQLPQLKNTKGLSVQVQKDKEAELLLRNLEKSDSVIVLDEGGKEHSSISFANFLQKKMNSGIKRLVFVVGGPYGFGDAVYDRANAKLSLSKMTFSHQMVRLFFVEQLYRAFTILNNEPYHHK